MFVLLLTAAVSSRVLAETTGNSGSDSELMINLFGKEMSLDQLTTYVWYGVIGLCCLIVLSCVLVIVCEVCCSGNSRSQLAVTAESFESSSR